MTTIFVLLALLRGFGPAQPVRSGQESIRFDYQVRADFFAGFAGDEARLKKHMEACELALVANPAHAEALVWHGSGLVIMAATAFNAGDRQKGGELWERGLKEMAAAVDLAPDSVAVRVPRGAILLQASRSIPGPAGKTLLEQGIGDYESVLAIQASYFATIGDHPRGELLFGLAEGYGRLGRPDKARMYFERIVNEAPAQDRRRGPTPG